MKPSSSRSKNLVYQLNAHLSKLKNSLDKGQFQTWSHQKKQYLILRILRLIRRLKTSGVKIAGALGIAVASCLSMQAQTMYGDPFTGPCTSNPFDGLSLYEFDETSSIYQRQPLSGDLDNDGDQDLLVISLEDGEGSSGYFLQYFENQNGSFVELTGEDNPLMIFNDEFANSGASPFFNFSLGDATLNGRLDLVLGEFKGEVICYSNTPDGFVPPEESQKDFGTLNGEDFASVKFANLDADCEKEIVITRTLSFNSGEETDNGITVFDLVDGSYTPSPDMAAMFDNIEVGNTTIYSPYFADLSGDGVDEAIFVALNGSESKVEINYYAKDVDGNYVLQFDEEDPFSNFDFGDNESENSPIFDFGDLDGDDSLNMYVGLKSENINDADSIDCISSPIAYEQDCLIDVAPAFTVPTMGQWGLIILNLLFVIFGISFFKERLNSFKQKIQEE
ncbi:hypothetical protein [Portibacter marinus]|uniref:hypothetical protein n=1 Tax=Portibacter marinus TaxID=2898660 RepID=UPI001F30597A|nr:hypothetical protein [Portibacter marinus]